MTDAEWAGENPPPKKKAVPTWLWFCGGGCLLAVVALVIVVMLAMKEIEFMGDTDKQWELLEDRIPFVEEQRPEWDMIGGTRIPFNGWMLTDAGTAIMIMDIGTGDSEEVRNQFFDENFDGSVFGMGGQDDKTVSTLEVQGTTVDVSQYTQTQGGTTSSIAIIDITAEEDVGLLLLMLTEPNSSDGFTDEKITSFLEPIRLGGE